MKRIFWACLMLLTVAGCEHWPWEPSTPEKAPGFPTYSGEPDKPYKAINVVSAQACSTVDHDLDSATTEPVMDELKFKARDLGADAVTHAACSKSTDTRKANCVMTIRCSGNAVRFTAKN